MKPRPGEPGGPAPEAPTPLALRLADRILAEGPISFAAFMDAALYDTEYGYYASGQVRLGEEDSDFRTSPEVHPLFGWMLAAQVAEMYQVLGRPERFRIVEAGPGSGRLAHAVLKAAATLLPQQPDSWEYVLVERSAALQSAQREVCAALPASLQARLRWADGEELSTDRKAGVVLSNEFFDALPVHRVQRQGSDLLEECVTWNEEVGFSSVPVKPGDARFEEYFEAYGVTLAEGRQAEVCFDALPWMDRLAASLSRGYILTIDYGDWAEGLYGPARRSGTLLAYRSHRVVTDLFRDVGLQDLTAHVNFTALARRGKEHGFEASALRTQTEFLLALGVLERMEEMDRSDPDEVSRWRNRLAAKELFVPGGMGETFRVLLQARKAPLDGLSGLAAPWRDNRI